MTSLRSFLLLSAGCVAATSARADVLSLTPATILDVSALNLSACGDVAFQANTNRLWLTGATSGGQIHAVSPTTGALQFTIDPGVIPGLSGGPDALAVGSPTIGSNHFVFSPFGEDEGGRINAVGTFLTDYGTSHGATGADFDNNGQLWVVCGTVAGPGKVLRRLAIADGTVLQTVNLDPGLTSRMVDVTFDPHTGACYVLTETGNLLHEIDLATGNSIASQDLSPFLLTGGVVAGGLDFDATGGRLFVCTGQNAGAAAVVVLDRHFARNVCSNGPTEIACPCNNAGQPGRGCNNSFNTGGGLLQSSGVPRVSADTFVLGVLGLSPSTSCLFFQGTANPVEIFAFGDGVRCVAGSVIRLGTKQTVAGAAQYPTGPDAPVHVRGAIPTGGATRFYQAWYRNVAAFCTPDGFNLTNGVKVIWAP